MRNKILGQSLSSKEIIEKNLVQNRKKNIKDWKLQQLSLKSQSLNHSLASQPQMFQFRVMNPESTFLDLVKNKSSLPDFSTTNQLFTSNSTTQINPEKDSICYEQHPRSVHYLSQLMDPLTCQGIPQCQINYDMKKQNNISENQMNGDIFLE